MKYQLTNSTRKITLDVLVNAKDDMGQLYPEIIYLSNIRCPCDKSKINEDIKAYFYQNIDTLVVRKMGKPGWPNYIYFELRNANVKSMKHTFANANHHVDVNATFQLASDPVINVV